jgi:hypothetical protein
VTWQPAAILVADIEAWAVTYLTTALAARSEPYADGDWDAAEPTTAKVANAVPNPRLDRMVTVRRDGGTPVEVFDRPRVNVGVWAMTDEDVIDLTRLVAALLWGAPDGDPVVRAEMVGGPVAVPDPSEQPRMSMTFEFHTRGEALVP